MFIQSYKYRDLSFYKKGYKNRHLTGRHHNIVIYLDKEK